MPPTHVGQCAEDVFPAVLDGVAVFCGPQFAQENVSVRPVCPPEKARAVFVRAALPLEALLLEPPGPQPGQFAAGNRVAPDDAKFAIDEIDIYRILPCLP